MPVAISTTQSRGYCRRSSSTTWSHFFLRQSLMRAGSVSVITYARYLPSGDQLTSPIPSAYVPNGHGSPPRSDIM